MPIQECESDGKPGFKWGPNGACFTYEAGDRQSRERAFDKAARQGRAIQARRSENRRRRRS